VVPPSVLKRQCMFGGLLTRDISQSQVEAWMDCLCLVASTPARSSRESWMSAGSHSPVTLLVAQPSRRSQVLSCAFGGSWLWGCDASACLCCMLRGRVSVGCYNRESFWWALTALAHFRDGSRGPSLHVRRSPGSLVVRSDQSSSSLVSCLGL
jgi:hypothetical protein